MGQKIDRPQIEEHFNYYFEDAYKKSNSEYAFEKYFRDKAYYNDIDLDNEKIESMFNDILKFNLREFKFRKENDRLKEEKEKSEKKQREELAKIKDQMERERIRNEEKQRKLIEEFKRKESRTMTMFENEIRKREEERREEEQRREEEREREKKIKKEEELRRKQMEEKRRQEEEKRRENERRERNEEKKEYQRRLEEQERRIREEENAKRQEMEEKRRKEEDRRREIEKQERMEERAKFQNQLDKERKIREQQDLERQKMEEKRRQEEEKRREVEKQERMEERAKFQSQLEQERKIREEQDLERQKMEEKRRQEEEKRREVEKQERMEERAKFQSQLEQERKIREEQDLERQKMEEKRRLEEEKRREIEKQERMEERAKFQSQLDQEKKLREEENKKRTIEFQNILKSEREKFQQIIKNNEEESNKAKKEYIQMVETIKAQAEEDKRNYEKQLEEEKNEKIKKINEDFNKEVENEINNEIQQLLIEFKKQESEFCLEKIKTFDISKLRNSIKTLIKLENIGGQIKEKVKNQISIFLDEPKRKVNHLNILVLGISGAGKSCLVKTLLGLDRNPSESAPKDGFFNPTTKGKPQYYISEIVPFLKIADTQGIEISSDDNPDKYGINEVEKDLTDFIKENDKSGNPDNYVHCIWYCFNPNRSRFEKDEEKLLAKLSQEYSRDTLPIILVGTQANSKSKVESFKEVFNNKKFNINFDFVPVMAKKLDDVEAYGLDKLQQVSIAKSKMAIKSKCHQGILQDVKNFFLSTLEAKSNELLQIIDENKEKCLKELSNGLKIDDLKIQIIDIFIIIFNGFNNLLEEKEENINQKSLCQESLECIGKFIQTFFSFCLEDYTICLNDFINKNTKNIAITINEFQNTYNSSHENAVYIKTIKQWENLLRNKILQEFQSLAEVYCNKNAFKFLADLLISNFNFVFNESYKHLIKPKRPTPTTKELDDLIESKIKNQFDDISKKVEEYQEKLKKEEEERRKKEEERRKREEEERIKKEEEEKKRKEEEERKRKEEEEEKIHQKSIENGGYDFEKDIFG